MLGITHTEAKALTAKWEATVELMREAARQDFERGNHEQGNHANGIADGMNICLFALKYLAGEYEGENSHRRLESVE